MTDDLQNESAKPKNLYLINVQTIKTKTIIQNWMIPKVLNQTIPNPRLNTLTNKNPTPGVDHL